jgi:hypothetical protein
MDISAHYFNDGGLEHMDSIDVSLTYYYRNGSHLQFLCILTNFFLSVQWEAMC